MPGRQRMISIFCEVIACDDEAITGATDGTVGDYFTRYIEKQHAGQKSSQ